MSSRSARFLLSVGLMVSVAPGMLAQAGKLGTGVTDRPATAIADLYAAPATFVGKTIRVEGVVTAVCEAMGCWMALAAADEGDKVVRFKVDHDKGIVFPIAARGRTATAEGIFERIADDEGREAASEHGGHGTAADFGKSFHVKATGAVIR
ncbi:MAG TPA: DUF4920 domain-containing protein [Vicinamibacterales bacterium]|nr:DUF4920 domain-containing protein [Vicinamibacterales bacterium]